MTVITSKTLLAKFPKGYPLKTACDAIREWEPRLIKCGYLEGIPYVYAEPKGRQFMNRAGKLVKQGVVFEANPYLPEFDKEDENALEEEPQPRVEMVPVVDNKLEEKLDEMNENIRDFRAENEESFEEMRKELKEIRKENKEIKELIKQLLNRKEPVATVERGGSAMRVSNRDIATSIPKDLPIPEAKETVEEPVKSAPKEAPKAKTPPKEAPKAKTPPKEAEAPVKPRRRVSTNMHIKPDDELPYVKGEYYDMGKEYAEKYQKISGINADKNKGFLISMGRGEKQYFYPSTYGDMDKAYAAAKAYLRAKITEGGFGTDKEAGDRWLEAYKKAHNYE